MPIERSMMTAAKTKASPGGSEAMGSLPYSCLCSGVVQIIFS